MAKIGKISTIKNADPNSSVQSLQNSLAQKGLTRLPNTGVTMTPYKEMDGKYRTGLDPEASYIKRIKDLTERELEIERVTELRTKLEYAVGDIDLGPRSKFWNYGLAENQDDDTHIRPIKLLDGDNYFDLENSYKELAFSWLRVHPSIATSYQAWERGDFSADTKFYVVDDDAESTLVYKKKSLVNKAIAKFEYMSPDKKKKIARLLGLPVTEDTKEMVVYNQIDTILKQVEFKSGSYQGMNPIDIFNRFADMKDGLLTIKDLIEQAITHSIYRVNKSNDKIYEGEFEVAIDKEELAKFLANDDNQEDLITLEQKLKSKKLALV